MIQFSFRSFFGDWRRPAEQKDPDQKVKLIRGRLKFHTSGYWWQSQIGINRIDDSSSVSRHFFEIFLRFFLKVVCDPNPGLIGHLNLTWPRIWIGILHRPKMNSWLEIQLDRMEINDSSTVSGHFFEIFWDFCDPGEGFSGHLNLTRARIWIVPDS